MGRIRDKEDNPSSRILKGDEANLAVEVTDGWLSFGRRKKTRSLVLKDLQVAIPRGAIYSLLGPSGCGKTTLLRCIVGRLHLDRGHILLFGNSPGYGTVEIPGRDVGYMPQELALCLELTITENLTYFSRLHGMNKAKCKERIKFLLGFLDLREDKKLVGNLSGGQQRRTSFAAALIHEPPLLILDEPTVGVDPLLRLSIWNHLLQLSKTNDVTVLITTHYIEEARQANMVGLMRSGHLLAEASPQFLLDRYQSDNLEKVFLKLCQTQNPEHKLVNGSVKTEKHSSCNNVVFTKHVECNVNINVSFRKKMKQIFRLPSSGKINALVIKNLTAFSRMIWFLLFQFVTPSIQIVLFCLAIGQIPHNIPISVANHDLGEGGSWFFGNLSQTIINQHPVGSMEEGISKVHEGKTKAVIFIGENFTDLLQQRFMNPLGSEEYIFESSIHIRMDMTNQQVAFSIQRELVRTFQSFMRSIASLTGLDPNITDSPLAFGDPIFGHENPTFTEFMAPGTVSAIAFFMAISLTSVAFIGDRKRGILDRTFTAGVNVVEVLLSHLVTQIGVMVIQVSLMLIFLIVVIDLPSQGPIIWVILLSFLQGLCGMAYGLLISSVCDEEISAIMLCMGTYFPNLILSGILWPLEAMPELLQYVGRMFPLTYPSESLRCVLMKGQGIEFMDVWMGYVISILWIAAFLFMSVIAMKIRRL